MPLKQLCNFQTAKAVTMASQHWYRTVTSYKRDFVFTVSTSSLNAGSYHEKKSNSLCRRGDIISLVPCVESVWFFLLSLWSYLLSNFITLQILWKWSLSWRGNWGDDQMIRFLSQTRGGNLPLISFYTSVGWLFYLKPACCLRGKMHQCCDV